MEGFTLTDDLSEKEARWKELLQDVAEGRIDIYELMELSRSFFSFFRELPEKDFFVRAFP